VSDRNEAIADDRVTTLYGERMLAPLASVFERLAADLVANAALGLILVDASPLGEIERLYGARAFRRTLEGLAQRLRTRLAREVGESFSVTAGALTEEHILLFFPRPRGDREFYTETLPQLADELRGYVGICLKKIAYPYLSEPPEIPVGFSLCLHRPFQRPETQIRCLVEQTLDSAQFELERERRVRAKTLERILFDEAISSVYEPIVRLADRTVIGYEALSRGPVGSGLESPLALFEVAERCGLQYELDALCRQRALRNARGLQPGMRLFLNILPMSIHHPDFESARVKEAVEGLGIAPKNLVLEISERQSISNFHIFREAIDHFSRLGFTIALDDVGTGYSSLEAAMELAPRFLKIDISLVRGIDSDVNKQELLRGLQNLARKMGSTIIAEGIETQEEFEAVCSLGIEWGQGHLMGRGGPIPSTPSPIGE
jgi:EAL domain-containing protein (putative c-di-GMP-specific phosphodiesterase class I)